ncbi:hypothetical protein BH09DEP1_BH09DEP1_4200 [soil metagenome]
MLRHLAITHDGEFSIEDLEQRISSELADDLGNLLNRMVALSLKYDLATLKPAAPMSDQTKALMLEAQITVAEFKQQFETGMFHMALARAWKLINLTNAYFHSQEPWKVAKTNPALFAEIMWATAHSLQTIAVLLWHIMPTKMETFLASLGLSLHFNADQIAALTAQPWSNTFMINKIDTLFEKPLAQEETTVTPAQALPPVIAQNNAIGIEEFAKVELTVGTIIDCQEIPSSDKLYKLQVDFGTLGIRQILSGIRQFFSPTELLNKQAVFVTNLKPRKMVGLESQGMLLTAQTPEKGLSIMSPSKAVENGTRLK